MFSTEAELVTAHAATFAQTGSYLKSKHRPCCLADHLVLDDGDKSREKSVTPNDRDRRYHFIYLL